MKLVEAFSVFYMLSLGSCSILKSCNESVPFLQLCSLSKSYIPGITDHIETDIPMEIQTIVSMFQLAEIDQYKDTVTINMVFAAYWNDSRLSINQPENEKRVNFYEIVESDVEKIYVPRMAFNSLEGMKRLPGWGPKDLDYFWFMRPHNVQYQQSIQVKLFCTFHFTSYPFDSNSCDMTFGSTSTLSHTTFFPRTIIKDANDNVVETRISKVNQSKLPFEIHLETLDPFDQLSVGFSYPFTGIRIHFKRDQLGLLYGGFYGPTGLFALLSLTSYTINPDAVPGRLGVLVTLYLIASNVYGSVKGPTNRGFSYIEIWMVGIQIPILGAIIEYGVILVMKKHQLEQKEKVHYAHHNDRELEIEQLSIKIDKWAFLVSLSFIIVFGVVYCCLAAIELGKNSF